MPVIFLTIRAIQAARIIKGPAFRSLSSPAQRRILVKFGIRTGIGAAKRSAIVGLTVTVVGFIIDPFNRFIVPHSRGLLVTSDQAVVELLSGRPSGAAVATTVFAIGDVILSAVPVVAKKVAVKVDQVINVRPLKAQTFPFAFED